LSLWQFFALMAVLYGFALFISHQTTVFEKTYWSGYDLKSLNESGEWIAGNRFDIGTESAIRRLRFEVNIDESPHWQKPVGLRIGGPFSAEVFWDGEPIGNKGKVGTDSDTETPGPIDFVAFIPQRLLGQGKHQVEVHLSTHHLWMRDDSVFHFIQLGPYRDNGRRELRYYAAPLIILSALLLLSFQSLRIGRSAGNPLHIGLGLFGFSISLLLMSEVSRAVVNYPYHFHELRGIAGWSSNILAGLALIFTAYKTLPGRLSKSILVAGFVLFIASHFMKMSSGDMRLAMDFILLALGPSFAGAALMFQRNIHYVSGFSLFWLACVFSNHLSTGLFLDSFQFLAALILIGGAWLWLYVKREIPASETKDESVSNCFEIRNAGTVTKIDTQICFGLKGEGNYTTLLLEDGKTLLHQNGLGAIMETNPAGFVRIHKSYAVNLRWVKQLKTAPGSKYWIELTNGETLPVSRYRVNELRSHMFS